MSDIHALVGAYAVDALDDIERAQFERHLRECADCQAEVDSLREASSLLAETTAVEPPAFLRDRVLADIKTVRPLPPLPAQEREASDEAAAAGAPTQLDTRRRRRRFPALVAAAAAIVAVGVGIQTDVIPTPFGSQTEGPQISATERVLDARDKTEVTKTFPGGAVATLVHSKSVGRAVLVTENMPAAPDGKVYEMWLQIDAEHGSVVPAGLMPAESDQQVLLKGDASDAVWAGITVEPEGGSTSPTSSPIAEFDLAQAST